MGCCDNTLARVRDVATRLQLIGHLPMVDVTTGQQTTVADSVPVWDTTR